MKINYLSFFKEKMEMHSAILKKFINYFAIFVIFSDALAWEAGRLFQVRASYFMLIIVIFLMRFFMKRIYFSRTFIIVFLFIISYSLANIFLGNSDIFLLLKQILGMSIHALAFYLLIKFNDEDIKKLFVIYLKVAFIIGLIGLIQEVAYLLHIRALFDFRYIFPNMFVPQVLYVVPFYRVNSIMTEPTSFCIAMMPAFFVSLYFFLKNDFSLIKKWKCSVILVSYLLSFSATGYIGIFLALCLVFLNILKKKYMILSLIIPALFILLTYSCVNDFRYRMCHLVDLVTNNIKPELANMSVFTLFNNIRVTEYVLETSPLFGYGLGSHPISFQQADIFSITIDRSYLNSYDANSLFLRLLSETGILGLGGFLAFIIIFYIPKKKDASGYLWLINNSILIMIILRLMRQGHYFSEGFFFFFWLYYFSKKKLKSRVTS